MSETPDAPTTARDRKKDEARGRIVDAFIDLLVEGGDDLSHDRIAERTGLGRRTVYRYFPDRESLMQATWTQVRARAGPQVALPRTEAELLSTLEPIYTGFDSIAPLATLLRATPQGRAIRRSSNAARVAAYSAVTAEAVKDLSPQDQTLATAMLQVLHTTPWLEMRDHWDLDGRQIARATGWAIRTLLADLRARAGLPLDQDTPAA